MPPQLRAGAAETTTTFSSAKTLTQKKAKFSVTLFQFYLSSISTGLTAMLKADSRIFQFYLSSISTKTNFAIYNNWTKFQFYLSSISTYSHP